MIVGRHRLHDDNIMYDKWLRIIILLGAATFFVSVNAAYNAFRNRKTLERVEVSRADLIERFRKMEASMRRMEQR